MHKGCTRDAHGTIPPAVPGDVRTPTLSPTDDPLSLSSSGGEDRGEEAVNPESRPCLPSRLCPRPPRFAGREKEASPLAQLLLASVENGSRSGKLDTVLGGFRSPVFSVDGQAWRSETTLVVRKQ
jgi:hypothetical protein